MTKIKKWYTLEKSTNKWVVWQNGEGEHSYGSYGIFRSESKKECLNFCKEKGIKGGRMCTDLGISKSLMTDLKSGRKKGVNAETAQKIATYFGVSVGYLLGEEETEIKKSPSAQITEGEQKLLDLFRRVPVNQQQMVLQMIEVALKNLE